MINVNQITAQLARMPDQALQQYAQMHKSDPYTLSLALNEANRRKQIRTEAQAGPNGPQPTVVDQGLADMGQQPQQPMPQGQPQPQMAQDMPEDVGIGALSAPNMQKMAEGGIVSFADGGEVPGFADGVYVGEGGQYSAEPLTDEELRKISPTKRLKQIADWASRNTEIDPETGEVVRKTERSAQPTSSDIYPDEAKRGVMTSPVRPVSAANPVALGGLGSTAPAARARGPVAPAPTPAPAAPATPLTIDQFMSKDPLTDPFATQRSTISEKQAKIDAQAKAEFEAGVASRGLAGEGKEKRLGERQAKLTEQAEASKNMSIVEAGLAMMQSRGRGLAGLAEGAGVGLKSYKAGIEKLTAAQERIDDARDQIDEYRRNEAGMTDRERRSLSREINGNTVAAEKDALKGLELAYGTKRDDAKAVFNVAAQAQNTTREIQSRENIAELSRKTQREIAGMPGPQMQMITALGGGDFRKGYEIFKQEGAIPKLYESYTKMASDQINGAQFLAKYPTFETYKAASGMMGGGGGGILNVPDNAAGNIRQR